MVPLCFLWCLWMEVNGINFEDRETTFEEIKYFFFDTMCPVISPLVISHHDFFILFAPTS
jgi:hypothetical protein